MAIDMSQQRSVTVWLQFQQLTCWQSAVYIGMSTYSPVTEILGTHVKFFHLNSLLVQSSPLPPPTSAAIPVNQGLTRDCACTQITDHCHF